MEANNEHYREVLEQIDTLAADSFNGTFVNFNALTIEVLRALLAGVNKNAEKILELTRRELRRS